MCTEERLTLTHAFLPLNLHFLDYFKEHSLADRGGKEPETPPKPLLSPGTMSLFPLEDKTRALPGPLLF